MQELGEPEQPDPVRHLVDVHLYEVDNASLLLCTQVLDLNKFEYLRNDRPALRQIEHYRIEVPLESVLQSSLTPRYFEHLLVQFGIA